MEDFYKLFNSLSNPMKKVLATIIRVTGSAYKKEGSAMFFFADGSQSGMVSAGCLESDLTYQAEKVLKINKPLTIQYDMSEESDFAWGQGAGCNGTIEVLLEPIKERHVRDYLILKKYLDDQIPVLVLKKLDRSGDYIFIPREGEPFGNWKGTVPVSFAVVKSGIIPNLPVFHHVYHPKPRLFVFGAGSDAKPLVSLAAKIGFAVTVCDWREAFCQEIHFPAAEKIIVGFPMEVLRHLSFTANDFIVIMSHHFQRDQELLVSLINKEVRYLGILGPRNRTRRLLNGGGIPIHVHSPVGIPISAQGPEEIAVSVVAEMINVLRSPVKEKVESIWMMPE